MAKYYSGRWREQKTKRDWRGDLNRKQYPAAASITVNTVPVTVLADRTAQPQEFTGVNKAWNPAAVWNLALDTELVYGQNSTVGPDSSRITTKYGREISVTGTANLDRYVLNCPKSTQDFGADDFTIISRFTLDDIAVTGSYGIVGRWNTGASAGTNDYFIGADPFNTNQGELRVEVGTTSIQAQVAVTWTIGHVYTAIGRRKGTTIYFDCYDHTDKIASSTSTTDAGITTVNFNAARKLKLGELDINGSPSLNSVITTSLVAIFKRSISDADVKKLFDNPWQLLAPREDSVFVVPKVLQAVTTHATSGVLTCPGSTIAGSAAHIVKHPTTGILTGQGSTIVGAAAHKVKHPTSGVLTGQASSVVGSAVHKAKHTTTGVLAGLVAAIAGTARRFRSHPTTGVLIGQGSTIVGSAAHKAKHTSTGVLTGQGSVIVGAARRFITHVTSGVLTGQGSAIVGSATHITAGGSHVTSGALTGQASSIAGAAAHKAKHTTTGVLTGQGSTIVGAAAHKAKHTTTGALIGQLAIITGSAAHKAKHTTTGALIGLDAIVTGLAINGTSVITKRFGVAYWKPVEKEEPIPEEEEVEVWTEPDLFEKLKETRANHEAIVKKAQQVELMEEQMRIKRRQLQDEKIIEMYLRSRK